MSEQRGSKRSGAPASILLGTILAFALISLARPVAYVEAAEECPDLHGMVLQAPSGATVSVPACEYRVGLVLDRPITLRGEPGATIVGSDVWTDWNGRTSLKAIPELEEPEVCRTEPACAVRQRVTIDGVLLRLVKGNPSTGEFAFDLSRHVVLGDDPAGRRVEVVVRQTWIVVNASDVTIEGFTMQHASNGPQTGAVRVETGVSRFALRDCDLGYAAGANVAFGTANDSVIENCDIHHAGQLGVHMGGDGTNGRNNILRNNHIHDNNTAGFDPEWEAGGLKATRQVGLRLEGNTVSANAGPGLWCDIYCRDIIVSGNRVHHNTHAGIFFEVSTGAKIAENRAWENGWGKNTWGWGAGILISSSGGAEIHGNVVAWNYAGISVISQNRQDWSHSVTNNYVHDNVVIAEHGRWASFWAQDWAGTLLAAASNNRGSANRYWVNHAEDSHWRFEWQGGKTSLSAFNATPAEEGGTYMSDSQKTAILADAGMPAAPTEGHPGEIPRGGALAIWAAIVVSSLLLAVTAVWFLNRRRSRAAAAR